MLPKFEYSHLHKFIVSMGLLFMAVAIALPWLVLRDSSPLLVPEADLRGLTPVARDVMAKKQADARWFADNYPYVSAALAAAGAALVTLGLVGWRKRQAVEDSRQLIERDTVKATLDETLERMTPKEVETKRAEEANEAVANEASVPNTRSRTEVMERLRDVEDRLVRLLVDAFPGYVVVPHIRLAGTGMRLDALAKAVDGRDAYVFEFKYTRSAEAFARRVRETRNLLLALGDAVRTHRAFPDEVHAVAIFVAPDAVGGRPLPTPDVGVVVIPESRLDRLTPRELRSAIDEATVPRPDGHLVGRT